MLMKFLLVIACIWLFFWGLSLFAKWQLNRWLKKQFGHLNQNSSGSQQRSSNQAQNDDKDSHQLVACDQCHSYVPKNTLRLTADNRALCQSCAKD